MENKRKVIIFYSGKNKNFNPKKLVADRILESKFGKSVPPLETNDFYLDNSKSREI